MTSYLKAPLPLASMSMSGPPESPLHGLLPPALAAVQRLLAGTRAAPIWSAARRFFRPFRSLSPKSKVK